MSATAVEEWVETDDGVRLWTATKGTGPPLVLCHGGPGLWDDQEAVASMVDGIVTVHRWDQRGCGRSTASGPYTVARFVADLEVLRAHFGHDRWVVGGHSWGATLALRYAFVHPGRGMAVLYLSGMGTGSAWKAAYYAERERRLTPEQHRRRNDLKGRERNDVEEREYKMLSWAPDYGDRSRALELAAREAAMAPFSVNYECNTTLNAETDAAEESDLLARCRTLNVPVLIVHGAEDPRPAWALDAMTEALPLAERQTLPGVGHVPWVEDPDGFTAVLQEFLKHVTRADNTHRGERDG